MKPSVYLAGPVTGLTYSGATDWREYVKRGLEPDITGYSPLRAKYYLAELTTIGDSHGDLHVMSTPKAIYARDLYDCRMRDLIFVNMLGATRVSIGTTMEIAWGAAFNKPIVLVMEREGNVHEHSMLKEACMYRVETLDEGIFVTRALLLP